jgi:hypothetical protein
MPNPPSNLLQRVWVRLQPDVESWLVDMGRYALLFLGLIAFFGLFKLLRSMGFNQTYVDILERVDHAGAGIIFGIYVLSLMRRAGASFSRYGK